MFSQPRPPSCSADDHSTDRPRRLFHRHYTHDLGTSSQSLHSTHDDLPTPLLHARAPHSSSAQSTPLTSPSTGYSSLFPGSLSSATSESVPSMDSKYRSEFGMLIPGPSSAYSTMRGSASSRSSNPVSRLWSSSPTESDPSATRIPRRRPSDRPFTAPNSPLTLATVSNADNSPADHHTRSHSRLTVSIKNIFNRHAVPSPSRFSFNSAATPPESEPSASSFQLPASAGMWSMTPRKSRPPDLEISGSVAPVVPSPGPASNSPIDAHRRYASEAPAKSSNTRTGSDGPTSQEGVDVSFRNAPPVRGRDPKTRNVLRRRSSGSAKLFKGRERGMRTPSRPNDGDANHPLPSKDGASRPGAFPFPLTPAGAVVEAYKQHELHRDETPSPPKFSIDDRTSSMASHDGHHDRDHLEKSPVPYYTVFGTSSERRVAAGSPDDRWGEFEADQSFTSLQPTLSHQPSMSDPGGRSLARKLSSRWRKVKGGGVAAEDSPLRDKGHSKARPSLSDLWGNDRSSVRSHGRSMDVVSNPADGAWASPSASHARSASKGGDKNEGLKLWQLMRRISTGGLRDRFQQPSEAVPPVPVIPKELLAKMNQAERNHDFPSTSRHQTSSSLYDKDQIRTSTSPRNITDARPSVATSCSSPNSSDVASTQFFQKSHSPRSSVSSYGDVVLPRVPESMLDRHIIAPLEQLRLADDHVEGGDTTSSQPAPRSPRRSTSVPAGLRTVENTEGAPLPSSRRQTCSGESPSSGSSRPCSTSPSTCGSRHASYQSPTCGQSRMADGTVSLSPPPRPSAKNSTRSVSMASSPWGVKQQQQDGGGARQIDRAPSGQSDMTARIHSPEPGRSRRHRESARTQCTFRELDAPRRPPLSEREKADIWNDLLARSDKAGGTLRIEGAAELLSDSMRLSTFSDA